VLNFISLRDDALIDVSRPGLDGPRSRPAPQWTVAVLGAAEALLTHPDQTVTVSSIREHTAIRSRQQRAHCGFSRTVVISSRPSAEDHGPPEEL